jgi:hypothetical protein
MCLTKAIHFIPLQKLHIAKASFTECIKFYDLRLSLLFLLVAIAGLGGSTLLLPVHIAGLSCSTIIFIFFNLLIDLTFPLAFSFLAAFFFSKTLACPGTQ